jgi:hypothetical protein
VRWFATHETDLSAEKFLGLFIEHYVRAHSIPTSIVSDRDVRFQSDFWRAFTKAMETRLRFSTAFHPQPDRLAENANDTVQTFLRAFAMSNVNTWDNLLTLAEFTYNASVHKVTQVTPFEAGLGYVPRLPIDFLLTPVRDATAGQKEAAEFTNKIEMRLREIRERL